VIGNVIRERGLSERPRFGGRHRKDFVVLDGDKVSRLAAFVENPGDGWMLGERRLDRELYDRDERA
jgi:hypothetical protein